MPDRLNASQRTGARAIPPRRRKRRTTQNNRRLPLAANADRAPAANRAPAEGLRLTKAFAQIGDAALRRKILEYVSEMSRR
jgi:hypothetical protein